jgi:uncharacterized membrane protein HdeD (DUF308 family)
VLRGHRAVLFGLVLLFWPLGTIEAVGLVFGAYAIVEGVLVVVAGLWRTRYRGVLIAEGATGLVAGLVALAWPDIVALVLLYVVAIWAVITGVLEILAAVSLRREIDGEWVLHFFGLLSVVRTSSKQRRGDAGREGAIEPECITLRGVELRPDLVETPLGKP